MKTVLLIAFCLLVSPCLLSAAEIDDVRKDLAVVQLRISEEEARYQEAKAKMERSQLVGQYLFPELRLREQQLTQKLQQLQDEDAKAKAEKSKAEKEKSEK